jgi:hypothetical protein
MKFEHNQTSMHGFEHAPGRPTCRAARRATATRRRPARSASARGRAVDPSRPTWASTRQRMDAAETDGAAAAAAGAAVCSRRGSSTRGARRRPVRGWVCWPRAPSMRATGRPRCCRPQASDRESAGNPCRHRPCRPRRASRDSTWPPVVLEFWVLWKFARAPAGAARPTK